MANLPVEITARELIEMIELWRDFVLGYKDVNPTARTAVVADESLLGRFYEMYRGHFDGTLSESTWRRLLATLPLLLSTNRFRAELDSAQTLFPEDFRAWLRSLRALPSSPDPSLETHS